MCVCVCVEREREREGGIQYALLVASVTPPLILLCPTEPGIPWLFPSELSILLHQTGS